jgi:hypothetical protein
MPKAVPAAVTIVPSQRRHGSHEAGGIHTDLWELRPSFPAIPLLKYLFKNHFPVSFFNPFLPCLPPVLRTTVSTVKTETLLHRLRMETSSITTLLVVSKPLGGLFRHPTVLPVTEDYPQKRPLHDPKHPHVITVQPLKRSEMQVCSLSLKVVEPLLIVLRSKPSYAQDLGTGEVRLDVFLLAA